MDKKVKSSYISWVLSSWIDPKCFVIESGLPRAFKGWKIGYKGLYAINKHFAKRLHFDLRLEKPVKTTFDSYFRIRKDKTPELEIIEKEKTYASCLESFALPKARLPKKSGDKVLAILVEPHPVEYITKLKYPFQIPAGEYGSPKDKPGRVYLEDRGTFEVLDISSKTIELEIKGKKYSGKYAIVLSKAPDRFWVVKMKEE